MPYLPFSHLIGGGDIIRLEDVQKEKSKGKREVQARA